MTTDNTIHLIQDFRDCPIMHAAMSNFHNNPFLQNKKMQIPPTIFPKRRREFL